MFCSNCGKKNPNNAQFCENCGSLLQTGSSTTGISRGLTVFENVKKHKTPLIIGIVAIIVVYLIASTVSKPVTPIKVAEKYLDALSHRNYAKAYKYINSELNMSEKAYVYSMQEIEKKVGPLKEYRIENAEFEREMGEGMASSYERSYMVVLGRDTREMQRLVVKNISAGEKPDWRVEPIDYFSKQELEVGNFPDIKVKVCGEEVKVNSNGLCVITYFSDIPLPIEISSPSIVTKKFQYPSQNEEYNASYQASDKLKPELTKAVNGFFAAFNKVFKEHNMDILEPYVVKGSKAWSDLERAIDYGQTSDIGIAVKRIEDSSKILFKDGKLRVVAKAYLEYRNTDGEVDSDTANIELVQDNGAWKVNSLY